jgi:hypothetical protein
MVVPFNKEMGIPPETSKITIPIVYEEYYKLFYIAEQPPLPRYNV